jgi:hypothetical protein
MFAQCSSAVAAIRQAGGPASLLKLSDAGLPGHDHMMMLDHDNLQIADRLIAWLDGAVK